ncbi:MAG: acyl-CoA dehydrogenase family protein [Pseudomonadota bacterium]
MAWDFQTEPEFQAKLEWAREFIDNKVKPLDVLFPGEHVLYDKSHPIYEALIFSLQDEVRSQGLWACHLPPELGGQGYGQVKLALLQEVLGHAFWAMVVFGCQAPDSGNAEILAHYGTDDQKAKYLQPLLDGKISSCFSMTEPQAGADPSLFECKAIRDGDEWVISGEKWYSSSSNVAAFNIVIAITNPDVPIYEGASVFLVPTNSAGLEIVRTTGNFSDNTTTEPGIHPYLRYNGVRVPLHNMLGEEGKGFMLAQVRLAGGRLHHAMRAVGTCQRALDMMCERALSRKTRKGTLARNSVVQEQIADTWLKVQNFRMQVLHAAWVMDHEGPLAHTTRLHVAGVKAATPEVVKEVTWSAMHLHGSLGVSNELPFGAMWDMAPVLACADGPTEVHKNTMAKEILRHYKGGDTLWPAEHLPARYQAAQKQYADVLDRISAPIGGAS